MSNVIYLSNPNSLGLIHSPDSLAYRAIILEKNIFSHFHRQYGNGLNLAQMDFGMAFGMSCAKYTVQKFAPTEQSIGQLQLVLKKFTELVNELHDTEYSAAIKALYDELYQQTPELFMHYNKYSVMKATLSQHIIITLLDGIYGDIVKSRIVNSNFNNYAFH